MLRAEATQEQQPQEQERRVQWAEDVVNNEGMGKKSSKGNGLRIVFAALH